MAMAERSAEVVWEGSLARGKGAIEAGSGALGTLGVTWASRTERADGRTRPEELIAAAHASCYAMSLSHTLSEDGHQPERLTVNAVCTLDPREGGGVEITSVHLSASGRVQGIDDTAFGDAARR